jgi:hypothetical protein
MPPEGFIEEKAKAWGMPDQSPGRKFQHPPSMDAGKKLSFIRLFPLYKRPLYPFFCRTDASLRGGILVFCLC